MELCQGKRFVQLRNPRGFIPIGLLLLIAIVSAVFWFIRTKPKELPSLPSLPSLPGYEQKPQTQKSMPATGVEFSSEAQSPENQARKYYKGHR